jgi:histidinol dehydrogenase
MASSILITTDKQIAKETAKQIDTQLQKLTRKDIAQVSIDTRGCIIVVETMDKAVKLMNQIAPEHLQILTQNPFELLSSVKNAGAVFLGENTPEPIGDYIAGPNHTLPTGGTARFFSPLGVEHFVKKSSIISFSKQAIKELGQHAIDIANSEGLTAHATSVKLRL